MLVSGFKKPSLSGSGNMAKGIIQRQPMDELQIPNFSADRYDMVDLLPHSLPCLPAEHQTTKMGSIWEQTYCFLFQNPNQVSQGQLALQKRIVLWELNFPTHHTVGCIGMRRKRDGRQSGKTPGFLDTCLHFRWGSASEA